jgi:hypothetical protein
MEFMNAKATHTSLQPYLSVEYANFAANAGSGHSGDGAMFDDVAEGYDKWGAIPERMALYQPSYDANWKPSDAQAAEGKTHRLLRPRLIRPNDGTYGLTDGQLHAIILSLNAGVPVAAGFRLVENINGSKDGQRYVWDFLPTDEPYYAHSMAIVGYKIAPNIKGGGYFIVRNSGGTNWMYGGYGYYAFDLVQKNVADVLVFDIRPRVPALTEQVNSGIARAAGKPEIAYASGSFLRNMPQVPPAK